MYKFKVSYGGRDKVCKTDRKDDIVDWVRKAFGILPTDAIGLNYIDEDFGEIPVDDCEELPDKGHVVVQASEIMLPDNAHRVLATVSTIFAEPSVLKTETPCAGNSIVERTDPADPDDPIATDRAAPPAVVDDPIATDRAAPPAVADDPIATDRAAPPAVADDPIATDRAAPPAVADDQGLLDESSLPPMLQVALHSSSKLSDRQWGALIQHIYDRCSARTYYPSKYLSMALQIVQRFGSSVHLHDNLDDTVDAIRAKLRTKFRNERYRHARESTQLEDERAAKRIKTGLQRGSSRGLANYYPTSGAGDDAVMIGLERLRKNWAGADTEALKTSTFAERRRMIVGLKLPMTRIRERLPWLMTEDELWAEFARVTGRETTREECQERWSEALRKMKRSIDTADSSGAADQADMTDDEAVKALISLLGTDIVFAMDKEVGAAIWEETETDTGGFRVTVDGVTVGSCADLCSAVLLWAVCHSIFAQHATRAGRPVLMLLQRYVLDVEDGTRVPTVCHKQAAFLGLSAPGTR